MFAYCENDPISNVDPKGKWTISIGWTIGAEAGGGGSYSQQIVIDSCGNISVMKTTSFVAGTPNASIAGLISFSNADSYEDLVGDSYSAGGSGGLGGSIGGDIGYSVSPKTGKEIVSVTAFAGASPIAAELHVSKGNTTVMSTIHLGKTGNHSISRGAAAFARIPLNSANRFVRRIVNGVSYANSHKARRLTK